MSYQKLSVDRFLVNLREGKYESPTGARRAIGKADWPEKEKARAREVTEKHFGGTVTVEKKPRGRAARGAKPRAVAAAVKKPIFTEAEAAPKRRGRPRKNPVVEAAVPSAPPSFLSVPVAPSSVPVLLNGDEAVSTLRQHAAATVIAAYRNASTLNTLEKQAYEIATREYCENALTATRTTAQEADEAPQLRTTEERRQHAALLRAAKISNFPVPVNGHTSS